MTSGFSLKTGEPWLLLYRGTGLGEKPCSGRGRIAKESATDAPNASVFLSAFALTLYDGMVI